MSERRTRIRLRRWRSGGRAWYLLLIAVLGIGLLAEPLVGVLRMASPDRSRVSDVRAVFGELPFHPLVLVGMDADLGTYPEVRPAVRAMLQDLLSHQARIAFVSFSPEGRAIATAELDRLEATGTPADQLLDLGFVAGAEAGLVLSVTHIAADADGPLAGEIRANGDGIAAFDLAMVVGGTDFGPRSWVEQVSTRLPELPLVAVVPTFVQPELVPYLRTGQLAALLGTVRDDAAYVADVEARLETTVDSGGGMRPVAMMLGMLVALAVIARSLYLRGRPEPADESDEEGAA